MLGGLFYLLTSGLQNFNKFDYFQTPRWTLFLCLLVVVGNFKWHCFTITLRPRDGSFQRVPCSGASVHRVLNAIPGDKNKDCWIVNTFQDDAKPHLPTDDLKLTEKQAHVTSVRSRRSSSQVELCIFALFPDCYFLLSILSQQFNSWCSIYNNI